MSNEERLHLIEKLLTEAIKKWFETKDPLTKLCNHIECNAKEYFK